MSLAAEKVMVKVSKTMHKVTGLGQCFMCFSFPMSYMNLQNDYNQGITEVNTYCIKCNNEFKDL